MEHIWSILCRSQIVDRERNNLSLIDIVEQINFGVKKEIDHVPVQLYLVSMWWRTDQGVSESAYERFQIIAPDGETLFTSPKIQIDLTLHTRSRTVIEVTGLPFKTNGIYKFVIQSALDEESEWINLALVPLEINREIVPDISSQAILYVSQFLSVGHYPKASCTCALS